MTNSRAHHAGDRGNGEPSVVPFPGRFLPELGAGFGSRPIFLSLFHVLDATAHPFQRIGIVLQRRGNP